YYRVSAIGPWGEGLGSAEVTARTKGGSVQVCWKPPAGATMFNIFRSLASDGRGSTETLIAAYVTGPCFMDGGAGMWSPAPGRLRGGPTAGTFGAGTHTYRVSAVVDGQETYASYAAAIVVTATDVGMGNGAVRLSWDAVPGASEYFVYRLDAGGYRR